MSALSKGWDPRSLEEWSWRVKVARSHRVQADRLAIRFLTFRVDLRSMVRRKLFVRLVLAAAVLTFWFAAGFVLSDRRHSALSSALVSERIKVGDAVLRKGDRSAAIFYAGLACGRAETAFEMFSCAELLWGANERVLAQSWFEKALQVARGTDAALIPKIEARLRSTPRQDQ